MRFAAAFVSLVLLVFVPAAAQAPKESDVAARLKDLADRYNTRDRRETLKLVEPIVALPDLAPSERVEALRIKGNAEIAVGSNDQAVATLQAALVALAAAPDARIGVSLRLSLANAYRGQKKLDLALRESRDAQRVIESLGDDALLLECLTGQIHYIPERDEPVWVPVADRAMALAERLGERGAQGRIQHILADRDFTKGEYASAVRRLELAVTSLRAAGPPEAISLSRALTSLGRARRAHGLPERALDAYREAMTVQKRIGDRFGVVQTWNAMGVAWGHLERPDKSLECYRHGLAEAVALGDQSAVQFMEGAVATALLRLGKANEAIPIFERLLAQDPEPYIARFRLATLADASLEVGRPRDALATLDKALALDHTSYPDAVAGFQFTRARANAALGQQDDAIADARGALETYERIRQSLLPLDFVKRGYADLIQGVFDFTVGAFEEAGRHAEAVETAEAARGRALADLMASRTQVASDGAPSPGANREAAALLTGAGRADAAPAGLDSPVATRALSARELSTLAAAHHTTIVSYWVGAERSFVWVIRGDGAVYSATLPVTRARLQQLVDRASLAPTIAVEGVAVKPDRAELALRRLYDTLIAPIDALLPAPGARLTLMPHGPLFSLSFAALTSRRGRYLVERYALHDVPSGAVLALGASRQASQATGWLLVADPQPRPAGAARLPALPGAAREIAAASATAPVHAVRRLAGAAASERAFRAALAEARVVHVAAHAVVPERDVAGAFLAFGPTRNGAPASDADGRLSSAEIYDLPINADLVVLSACRSGRGRITGDGVAGFTRAFISAGARTVVASLWDAPDQTTRRVMAGFYRQLAAGHDKAESLRAAQRALLADLRAGRVKVGSPAGEVVLPPHPALWAGFRVHGLP